jgi:hypothetical protein
MNSTPMLMQTQQQTTISGSVDGRPVNGVATTTSGTFVPPAGSTSINTRQPTIPILIDWRANPRVPMLGRTIVIESADAISLVYRVE